MKITAILIDDERKSLLTLKEKIERSHPNIDIIKAAQEPYVGLNSINTLQPDLVFLDIAMPQMNGFELLSKVNNPSFELIFTTAFDQYAIEAINLCAIGYLLKPIDNTALRAAIKRAEANIMEKSAYVKNRLLIENLSLSNLSNKKMMVSVQDGFELVNIKDIIHCEGVNGYTRLHIQGRKSILSSNSIGFFEKNLSPYFRMCMVHKSHLINIDFIEKYLNEGYLKLINKDKIPVSKSRKHILFEALNRANNN
ncbi:LytR/AlgR family response regulator transcription factor [Winogradskyella sp.]|uniref:LytR/AlgR family response regulator transcription factor n=1 Tax=Winogradskyella sp. TaxID=1883156 RepID=UPI003BA91688